MKTLTFEGKHGIQWTDWMQLDNLNLADDLAFLNRTHKQIWVKASIVAEASASVGLNIHKRKATSSNTTRRTPT
ncbi:unnamed protein product [Schistosoma margrebowiei]|uniref:Uncharacterized protein n=1 Tax=Schistosoma margrebowiei TaxID=48269 RepID=A0A183LPU6_9TREM|nr:unnamed protein product [Schistosoma margrebowiei]